MFQRINKKERINEWIEWVDINVEIVVPKWGEKISRGWYVPEEKVIKINGKQSEKEIIKSIIHEVCHWVNDDKVDDPDIWERESRCQKVEKQWKVVPDEVVWE